jgi:hypothetical protein
MNGSGQDCDSCAVLALRQTVEGRKEIRMAKKAKKADKKATKKAK